MIFNWCFGSATATNLYPKVCSCLVRHDHLLSLFWSCNQRRRMFPSIDTPLRHTWFLRLQFAMTCTFVGMRALSEICAPVRKKHSHILRNVKIIENLTYLCFLIVFSKKANMSDAFSITSLNFSSYQHTSNIFRIYDFDCKIIFSLT